MRLAPDAALPEREAEIRNGRGQRIVGKPHELGEVLVGGAEVQRVRGPGVIDQWEDELRIGDTALAEHTDGAHRGHVAVRVDIREGEAVAVPLPPAGDVTAGPYLDLGRLLRRGLVLERHAVEAIEEVVVAERGDG